VFSVQKTNRICQFLWMATTGVVWISLVAAAVAQEDTEELADTGRGKWALCYALVALGVALGMLVVCRPGKRQVLETDD